MSKFKNQFGIAVFILSIIFLFNSFLAFLILAIVGSLIFPKSREYIESKIKLSRMAKNALILFLFPIGLVLGIYKTVSGIGETSEKEELDLESSLKSKNLTICGICKDLKLTKDTIKYKSAINTELEKVLKYCAECSKQESENVKDSLNRILEPKKLDVCMVCSDLNVIDLACIQKADKKFPNFGIQHTEYTKQCQNESYLEYRKKHNLNQDLFTQIIGFAYECSESERMTNIANAKREKESKEERKEKIEECLGKACNEIQSRIIDKINNPKSFEQVSCEFAGSNEEYFEIQYIFRQENAFSAIIKQEVRVKVKISDCSIVGIQE